MKVISMFSGAGGLDLGFIFAGHEIVWANDFDKDAVESYKKNIIHYMPHEIILGDICEYLNCSEEEINKKVPDADIIIGGFPCQGFSIANIDRNMNDSRNYLYLEILKMINAKNIKYFLLENVKGLENMEKGRILEVIINDLEKVGKGYTVYYNVINASNYGVPQNRERVIIFGVRNDMKNSFEIPLIKEKTKKNKKVLKIETTHSNNGEMIESIKPHEKINKSYESFIKNELNELDIKVNNSNGKYKWRTVHDAINDLPFHFSEENHNIYNHSGTKCIVRINGNVGNREVPWDKVSPTIMGRGSGTGGPLIIPHPEKHRRMSVREVARIQTFPDKFIFQGSNSAGYRQIGNAVPPLMAYYIGKIFPKEV